MQKIAAASPTTRTTTAMAQFVEEELYSQRVKNLYISSKNIDLIVFSSLSSMLPVRIDFYTICVCV